MTTGLPSAGIGRAGQDWPADAARVVTARPPRLCEACGASDFDVPLEIRGYRIAVCRRCDLRFVLDPPLPVDLAAVYDKSFFELGHKFGTGDLVPRGARRNAEKRLAMIGPAAGRLLDVGCATGDFLVQARRRGWEVAGIDVSPFASAEAVKRGLDVRSGSFLDAGFSERFNVLTLWDYIEHVPNPLRHMEHARSLLAPGGRLLLSTGDASSWIARLSGQRWHLLIPPTHLFFFTGGSLTRLLERAGFELEWIRWPGKFVNMGFVIDKTQAMFPRWPTHAAARVAKGLGVGRLDLYVNLFDIMTVAARVKKG